MQCLIVSMVLAFLSRFFSNVFNKMEMLKSTSGIFSGCDDPKMVVTAKVKVINPLSSKFPPFFSPLSKA